MFCRRRGLDASPWPFLLKEVLENFGQAGLGLVSFGALRGGSPAFGAGFWFFGVPRMTRIADHRIRRPNESHVSGPEFRNYALAVEGPDEFLWHRAAGRTPHIESRY